MANFTNLVSPQPGLNATLVGGHLIAGVLSASGFTNVRLYASPNSTVGNPRPYIPETAGEDDIEFVDPANTLDAMGVPQTLAINLYYTIHEDTTGVDERPNPRSVAGSLKYFTDRPSDPVGGLQELFNSLKPIVPPRGGNAASVAVGLPGVAAAISAAISAFGKGQA